MSGNHELDSLNSVKYLYLRKLTEPRDNSLQILVEEAVVNPSAQVQVPERPELGALFTEISRIESVDGCKTFELSWKHSIAYLVTEELVGSNGTYSDETFTGSVFRAYTKSHFLEHLARDTGGHLEPIMHYKLICLNHLIDVASYSPPEIRMLGQASAP